MRRMMPSQVAKIIQDQFPNCMLSRPNISIGRSDGTLLVGVLDMIATIPDNLWIHDDDYAHLLLTRSVITSTMEAWHQGSARTGGMPSVNGKNIPLLLYEILSRCPDEHSPPPHAELSFIEPAALRESIRIDVGGAYRAIQHDEWKAASILGGAAIEALLYWRLGVVTKIGREKAESAPSKQFSDWNLSDMISVAKDLGILTDKQAIAATLAKGYRNLIHPGVAARQSENCTRSTAYSAIAGMEAVIEALTP